MYSSKSLAAWVSYRSMRCLLLVGIAVVGLAGCSEEEGDDLERNGRAQGSRDDVGNALTGDDVDRARLAIDVVHATISEAVTRPCSGSESGAACTFSTLSVHRSVRGVAAASVELITRGGESEGILMYPSGSPVVRPGHIAVVFLQELPNRDGYTTQDGDAGYVLVTEDGIRESGTTPDAFLDALMVELTP